MKLALLAYMEEDGSGVFSHEGRLYYIAPPYEAEKEITPAQFERLLASLDYTQTEEVFRTFDAMAGRLRNLGEAWVNPLGPSSLSEEQLARSLEGLPAESLRFMIDDLRARYLRMRKPQAALNMVAVLLKVKTIREDDALLDALYKLKHDCEAKLEIQQSIVARPPLRSLFPLVAAQYGSERLPPLQPFIPGT